MASLKEKLGLIKINLLRKLVPGYRWDRDFESEYGHFDALFNNFDALEEEVKVDVRNRMNPEREVEPELAKLLKGRQSPVRVLDVGCGPLSSTGVRVEGKPIELHGADPLADRYKVLLEKLGISPNCVLHQTNCTNLEDLFGANSFDLVTADNSLDHSDDPMVVIQQMGAVCKVGCCVWLRHSESEGLDNRYRGLHQWNFYQKGGRPFVSNGHNRDDDILKNLPNFSLAAAEKYRRYGKNKLIWTFRKERA